MQEIRSWTSMLLLATVAVTLAAVGLAGAVWGAGIAPALSSALLVASLAATAGSFAVLAARVRRLELENEGLIEEVSQEFDRVKDKLEIFSEAMVEPRSLSPEAPARSRDEPARRVAVK